jgi:Tfp pilus assembly protein PilW
MIAVVVGLFLVVGLAAVQNMYRQSQSIIGLAFEMKAAAASGKGLAWHGATKVPEWALTVGGIPGVVIGLSAIAAAVYFFFHCRRANRKAEDGAAQPKA